ncbi:MAG: hypothetical protein ABJO09_18060 [Hyphomicrobiales bacterium]
MPNKCCERAWQERLALTDLEAECALRLLQNLPHNAPQAASEAMRDHLMDYAASEPELAALLFAYFVSGKTPKNPSCSSPAPPL